MTLQKAITTLEEIAIKLRQSGWKEQAEVIEGIAVEIAEESNKMR